MREVLAQLLPWWEAGETVGMGRRRRQQAGMKRDQQPVRKRQPRQRGGEQGFVAALRGHGNLRAALAQGLDRAAPLEAGHAIDQVLAGDRIILTKSDSEAGGVHHSLSCSDVERVENDRVILECSAEKARERWRDENRDRALFERRGVEPLHR